MTVVQVFRYLLNYTLGNDEYYRKDSAHQGSRNIAWTSIAYNARSFEQNMRRSYRSTVFQVVLFARWKGQLSFARRCKTVRVLFIRFNENLSIKM